MKKYLMLYILALVCLVQTAMAQAPISNTREEKQVQWPFPDKLVKPAALKIQAQIPDIKKPFVASLSYTQEVVNKARALCASQKSTTLILDAERINNFTANLKWETKNAFKASGFNIERSLADTFHFVMINFAAASTGSGIKKNYQLPDHNDYSGLSFYRIKQHNGDTGFAYSNIVSVKGYDVLLLSIFPSPASDRIWIKFTAKQNGSAAIILYDASGKIVQQQKLNCTANASAQEIINIKKLLAGVYQVELITPDKTLLTGKFIKQ